MKMENIKIRIYILSDSINLEECLKMALPIEGADCWIQTVHSGQQLKYDSESIVVIITSSMEEIEKNKIIAEECYRYYPVYIESFAEDCTIPDYITALWPAEESGDARTFRFKKLIKLITTEAYEWIYDTFLHTAIDHIPELVWFKDKKGAHVMVNQAFAQTVHKTREDVEGRGHYYIWDITPEEYSSGEYVCLESEEQVISAKRTLVFEEPVKTRDGMMHFITYKSPIFNKHNEVIGTVGVAHNVSDFSNMGIQLSLLIENIPFPLLICTAEWGLVQVNSYFQSVFKIDGALLASFDYKNWKSECLKPVSEKKRDETKHSVSQEFVFERKGIEFIYVVVEQEIRDYFFNSSGFFVLFHDVTIERNYERKILQAANTDPLTNLYNRRYFYEYVQKLSGKPVTLLYMDLDHFKEINDNFGHNRGDDVLRRTARYILEIFPNGIAFRLGGDEFAVLIEGIPEEEEIQEQCDSMVRSIKDMFRSEDSRFSVSIGMVSTDGKSMDIDELIHQGDEAMYSIKRKHHEEGR
ncbi:PAS domain S-box-containing protein/diguanylate cyclase (GGDEF) domain-containing protein [Lachnospiraceae bacterium]|nr:PAS domain S-box-containing protein/diguanylate cyclase (GGDEF) domain-containing protein [Lachnospiraceae bacterium]